MPAVSPAQQRLFGMVLAMKRGQMKNPPAKIKKVASGVNESQAADFAATTVAKKKRSSVTKSLMQAPSGY